MGKDEVIVQRSAVGGGPRGTSEDRPQAVTGVQLAQGIGVQPAKGFWADAWANVVRRNTARFALAWLSVVATLAIISPLIANGHPILLRELDGSGKVLSVSSPMLRNFSVGDVLLILGGVGGLAFFAGARGLSRSERLGTIFVSSVGSGLAVVLTALVFSVMRGHESDAVREWLRRGQVRLWSGLDLTVGRLVIAGVIAALGGVLIWLFAPISKGRLTAAGIVAVATAMVSTIWWSKPLQTFEYQEAQAAGRVKATFTVIPFSPSQRDVRGDLLSPGRYAGESRREAPKPAMPGTPKHLLGTDSLGQDVLSQLLHACRLSISIGLVSTGIAVMIGTTIGATMGYFGGRVDLFLYRVVEMFMSVPVLFLLIVAAAVLPRNTYVMMAIIGCVTWTGAARFTRAEFMKLRNQDFVQAARAMGLPLRSILFKHMLPNGVTPVLVDASFAIAAAILAEATLSYLGLGPEEQPSWGRLLSDATNSVGDFVWWLAIFPGFAIFLSVLSYNLLGEALRDAIDPKLKKARV
jgi:peptide/nickel transport system permease protein